MQSIRILGVTVHDITAKEVQDFFVVALAGSAQNFVCTPNPEILLHAHRHPEFASILNTAQLALPDGRGLQLVGGLKNRVTGVDAASDLLRIANEQRKSICCVVRSDGRSTAEHIQKAVQQIAPLAVVNCVAVSKHATSSAEELDQIRAVKPDIILVGLGFPEQELWLSTHLNQIPSARIGMAIGGTFDFWVGTATRAPKAFQTLGIEWLWRLIRQPNRIKRIWNAVVIFPLTVVFTRNKNRS